MNAYYPLSHFVHVVGALGLFAALGIEWLSIRRLRTVTTTEEAMEWMRPVSVLSRLYPVSIAALLLTAIHMTIAAWRHTGWVPVGFAGMILMGVLGNAVTGRRLRAIGQALKRERGPLSDALQAAMQDGRLLASLHTRVAVGLGVVFLMTVKPDLVGSLLTLGVAILVGLGASAVFGSRERITPSAA